MEKQITIRPTNLGELRKLLDEASDLTEQLDDKLSAIRGFEIELETKDIGLKGGRHGK